ncbi:MAG: GNAT family N-acetyltransferase [Gemmatimonadota bacterium]
MGSVWVRPVESSRDLDTFIRFPRSIYLGRYRQWVPPLLAEERKRFDRSEHPFFQHGEAQLFLAFRDGRPAGRIAAIENRLHNEFHEDRVGFFGFFEAIAESDVVHALVEAASEWCRARGFTSLRGPANYSTNETCGLLVDGFEDPPTILMPYNPPYYEPLLECAGFRKARDLLAHRAEIGNFHIERINRLLERALARNEGVRVRPVNLKRFGDEVRIIREIYNAAWEKNWGFVPMTDAEIDKLAHDLKPVIEPKLVCIGEVEGRSAGFALALPDVNQAIRHANGRLWPLGLLRILWHMRKIDRMRVIALGVRPEYRRSGLDGLLYRQLFQAGVEEGLPRGESSWILEDNHAMQRALERTGFSLYKTYRMYDKDLG